MNRFLISHFSFLISHFSFLISHFSFEPVWLVVTVICDSDRAASLTESPATAATGVDVAFLGSSACGAPRPGVWVAVSAYPFTGFESAFPFPADRGGSQSGVTAKPGRADCDRVRQLLKHERHRQRVKPVRGGQNNLGKTSRFGK